MMQMWVTEGTEGWWKAHGWREVSRRKVEAADFHETLLEHDEIEEEEE